MKYKTLDGINASRLSLGMMRVHDKRPKDVERLILSAVDMGVNLFDNADIYGGGASESLFGEVVAGSRLRDRIIVQTKVGIGKHMYDLSYGHIIEAVNGSLARLKTDTIDILLLHRPDTLMRPEEIARAFDELEKSGKVKAFGVSNFSAAQIDYLQSRLNQKICVDQMRLSPTYCPLIDSGINVNTPVPDDGTSGTLEYCRKNGITVQTYGTMQCSFTDEKGLMYSGALFSPRAREKYFSLNFVLEGLAQKYGTTPDAVALAWVLFHPAEMQAIVGTTNVDRLKGYSDCCEIPLTAAEWYKIYEAAGHVIP